MYSNVVFILKHHNFYDANMFNINNKNAYKN